MEELDYKKTIKKDDLKNRKKTNTGWIITVTIMAFMISVLFSFISELVMPKVNIYIGILIMFIFIGLGILFDIIGVAVTSAVEKPFHSMSAKKIKGAAIAVNFKKNADKVSSFCNDVIGDICGIISGSAGVYVASSLARALDLNALISSLLITGIISCLTIGGKAIGKGYAMNNSTMILFNFSKFISNFTKRD